MTFHRFMSGDSDTVVCLTCGGTWDVERENDTSACAGNTRAVHGDPWEQGHGLECDHYREQGACGHLEATRDCNCNWCTY